jgi:nucleoside-diphosphate-sugar epimerase
MRALVTGATGFIGGRLAARLVEQGFDVTALVRSPERAAPLRNRGVTLVPGDITEPESLRGPMRRADAVFHLAAWYALGVPDRTRMYQINVRGTEAVMWEAAEAGVSRIVYCSSVAALGARAEGEVADESSPHPGRFGSTYEETKWLAHRRVRELAAEGLPVVTVLPGAVYGPGDQSILGVLLRLYAKGWLIVCPFLGAGLSWVAVDDVAQGIVAALEKGRAGEDYVLGGDNATIGELLRRLEPLTGVRAPRFGVPGWVMRAGVPLSPVIARALGQAPRIVTDGLASMKGSWMASSEKARRELGYAFRSIEEGMPQAIDWFREH